MWNLRIDLVLDGSEKSARLEPVVRLKKYISCSVPATCHGRVVAG